MSDIIIYIFSGVGIIFTVLLLFVSGYYLRDSHWKKKHLNKEHRLLYLIENLEDVLTENKLENEIARWCRWHIMDFVLSENTRSRYQITESLYKMCGAQNIKIPDKN